MKVITFKLRDADLQVLNYLVSWLNRSRSAVIRSAIAFCLDHIDKCKEYIETEVDLYTILRSKKKT